MYLFVQSTDEETHGYVSGADDMSGNVHLNFQVYHYLYSVLHMYMYMLLHGMIMDCEIVL